MSYRGENVLETVTVDRDGREYVVEFVGDLDAPNPLEDFDHEGIEWIVVDGHNVVADSMTAADGDALRTWVEEYGEFGIDEVTRRWNKYVTITRQKHLVLVTGGGIGHSQGDSHTWYAVVDSARTWTDEDGTVTPLFNDECTPELCATGAMDEYTDWRYGNTYGWVLTGPDGTEIASMWGYYGDDYEDGYSREAWTAEIDQAEQVYTSDEAEIHEEMLAEIGGVLA